MDSKLKQAILSTLAYQKVFEFAPTKETLYQQLISDKPYTEDEFEQALSDLDILQNQDGHLYIGNDIEIAKQSREKSKWSNEKIVKAEKIGRILSKIPWIKMIGISGAVSSFNATKDDDIDLFVIVEHDRLWLARLFDWILLNALRVRRNASSTEFNDKICINYYLTDKDLKLENQDLYTAIEITKLIPIYNHAAYFYFVRKNDWIKGYQATFWEEQKNAESKYHTSKFKLKVFTGLNSMIGKLQVDHMKKRQTKEKVSEHELRFHPKDRRHITIEKHKDILDNILTEHGDRI